MANKDKTKSFFHSSDESSETNRWNTETQKVLYDYMPLSYQSLDSKGCFLDINLSWLKLLGYERQAVIGKNFSQFLHPEYRLVFQKNFPDLIKNGCVADVRFKLKHKKGHYLDISLTGNIIQHADGRFRETFCILYDITDQIQTREKLEKSQRELKSIFRIAPTGIGVVKERTLYKVNDKLLEMTDYSREELLGKSARILYPTDKDFEYVGTEKYKQISTMGSGTVETQFKRKDGKIIDILMSSTPLNADDLSIGVTFTALEITKRKNAEKALRESEERYRSILESMDDAAYICSSEYKIEFMNPAMEKMVGENAVGTLCYESIFGFNSKCRKCFFDIIKQGENFKSELFLKRNGRSYHTSNSPIKHPDDSISMLTVFRDITEIKKMEQQIQQTQKMESIGNLAGGIAHDFNNILFPIIGMSELLMEDLSKDSLEYENAQEIYHAGKRAKDLVSQILAFSRQSENEMMPVRLQKVLKEVLKLCRASIPTNIEIEQNIQQDCKSVWANATQLHQVGMNLITNAYHAVQDHNGKITIDLKEIVIGSDQTISSAISPGKYALLSVTDNGRGMSDHIKSQIFDPYFTTKEKGKGTGLGLAVVYGIVKELGGDIQVHSQIDLGTIFDVYIPLMKTKADEESSRLKEEIYTGDEHILLVDDDPSVARLFQLMLERLGYAVTLRMSSIEALEVFKKKSKTFDMVISDMSMPQMTGDQLAHEIRQIAPDMLIIICTGFSERINKEKAEEIGVNGFLMKPIVKRDMAQMIRKVFDIGLALEDGAMTGLC